MHSAFKVTYSASAIQNTSVIAMIFVDIRPTR